MFTIRVVQTREQFVCAPGHDLLQSARRHGVPIPSGCRGGGCGMCKIRVVSGDYERGTCSEAVLSDDERSAHYTLACKTSPMTHLEIELPEMK